MAADRGSPALSTTVTVQVQVTDVNDNSPVFSRSSYSVDVSEDAPEGDRVLEVDVLQETWNRRCLDDAFGFLMLCIMCRCRLQMLTTP